MKLINSFTALKHYYARATLYHGMRSAVEYKFSRLSTAGSWTKQIQIVITALNCNWQLFKIYSVVSKEGDVA